MIRFGKYVVTVFALLAAVPVGVFATVFVSGSFTGDHAIKYDRSGTWVCWQPHDPSKHGNIAQSCWMLANLVPVSQLDDMAPSARGYIRCRGSQLEIGNFDVSAGVKGPIFESMSCDNR